MSHVKNFKIKNLKGVIFTIQENIKAKFILHDILLKKINFTYRKNM